MLKLLLLGDAGVGKTSLLNQFVNREFTAQYKATIGSDFSSKQIDVDGHYVTLQIWDTAGQEQYRSLGRAYYRSAVGILLVFSYDNHTSFESLERWLTDVKSLCHPHARILLIGSKSDLVEERKITRSEIDSFVKSFDLEFMESSAKDNINVEEAFFKLSRDVLNAVQLNEIQLSNAPSIVKVNENKNKKDGCC